MSNSDAQVVWRVRAKGSTDDAIAFDASLIFHTVRDPRTLIPGEALRAPCRGYYNRPVPFEETLADEPFTLVLRAHDGRTPLVVEFESTHSRGSASTGERADGSPVVIVHTEHGDAYAGLPHSPQADHGFDWTSAMEQRRSESES